MAADTTMLADMLAAAFAPPRLPRHARLPPLSIFAAVYAAAADVYVVVLLPICRAMSAYAAFCYATFVSEAHAPLRTLSRLRYCCLIFFRCCASPFGHCHFSLFSARRRLLAADASPLDFFADDTHAA